MLRVLKEKILLHHNIQTKELPEVIPQQFTYYN